jgi:hypothetical protein
MAAANPDAGALGAGVSPGDLLNGALSSWEVANALDALASPSSGGVRLCYLRVVREDALPTSPVWEKAHFQAAAPSRGAAHFMQHGCELLALETWAARVRASTFLRRLMRLATFQIREDH